MRTFRLFPEEQRWWSFADHEQLMRLVEEVQPRSVLEFGPGSSTLSFIEGGAEHITTCENDPAWIAHFNPTLAPHLISIVPFVLADPITMPMIDGLIYELGFVDGPNGSGNRREAIAYAHAHCMVVACHDAHHEIVQSQLRALPGRRVEIREYHRTPNGDLNALGIAWPC
jgi:hypothetical protein